MEKQLVVGRTYAVTTASECSVTDSNGLVLTTASAGEQKAFVATTTTITFSDDSASVVAVFNSAPALGSGGGSYTLTAEDVQEVVPIAWNNEVTLFGVGAKYYWGDTVIGAGASANGGAVSVGCKAIGGTHSTIVGYNSESRNYSVSVGYKTSALSPTTITIGAQFTEKVDGTVVNRTCKAEGTGSITIGAGANTLNGDTESSNAVTVGCKAANSAADSVCVGAGAQVSAGGGIAIGAGAVCADVGAVVFASYSSDRSYKTQLYFAGAGTPLAVQYYNGEAMIGYIVTDSAGNTVACGTNKLSALFPDNSATQAAAIDDDGEWVMPTLFAPNDVKAEPSAQTYTPLPVYPIVEPEIEDLTDNE